jgi:hypothetical protein
MISCMLCDTKGHLTYSYQFLMFESANVLYSLAAETKRERERGHRIENKQNSWLCHSQSSVSILTDLSLGIQLKR